MGRISSLLSRAALAVGATAANATTVNELVNFTVGGFTSAFGEPCQPTRSPDHSPSPLIRRRPIPTRQSGSN